MNYADKPTGSFIEYRANDMCLQAEASKILQHSEKF